MAEFSTSLDIGNAALQLLGVPRVTSFTQDAKAASALAFIYDKVRRAELQRNCWRFSTRVVALRAIDPSVMQLVPAAWSPVETYPLGAIVAFGGQVWQALLPVPVNQTPDGTDIYWDLYFGSMNVTAWANPLSSTSTTTVGGYYAGELVYVLTGTTPLVFLSLQNGNTDNPAVVPAWSATTLYNVGDTVTFPNTPVTYNAIPVTYNGVAVVYGPVFQSAQDLNLNQTPGVGTAWVPVPGNEAEVMEGQHWLLLNAGIQSFRFVYPIGAGPGTQSTTRNAFQLPNGYLKLAPQDPRAGQISFLGSPSGSTPNDWVMQGNYITTADTNLILVRFAADITSVPSMTSMFCNGLACRIATAVCEELTQSTQKLSMVANEYKGFMGEARMSNSIENSTTEPPIDDWIAARI